MELGILYCNGAHASTESVADMALYHIISVFRHMTWSALAARSNNSTEWTRAHRLIPFRSHNPRGHTLGIIGLGNIGYAIAKKVHAALGMKIIYHDIIQKKPEVEREAGATFFPSMDEMLRASDCVLVATTYTSRPILDAHTLSCLPTGARVVNIARGVCVDEDALADALESHHVSAAGLDVHMREPHVSERLSRMPNVTLTSHTGGGSIETATGFERLVMENVDAVLQGRDALTAVNQSLVDAYYHRSRVPLQTEEMSINGVNGHGTGYGHDGDGNGNGTALPNGHGESLMSAPVNGETFVSNETIDPITVTSTSVPGKTINPPLASTAVGNT